MDVGTLFRLALPIALACGVLQLAAWLVDRKRFEPLLWAAADFIGLAGGALITTRMPPVWLSATVGNVLIVGSALLIWSGLRRCIGMRVPIRGFIVALIVFGVLFYSLWLFGNDLGLRVLTSSIVLSFCNAGIAFDLARGGDQSDRRIRGFLSLIFAVHALFFLFRAATAMTLEAEDEFLRTGGLQAITVMIATIKLLVWNGGALVLQRGDRQSRSGASLA